MGSAMNRSIVRPSTTMSGLMSFSPEALGPVCLVLGPREVVSFDWMPRVLTGYV